MRVRALRTTHGSYGTLPRGCVAEISDHEAKEMITLGYMIEDVPLANQEAAPTDDNRPLAPAEGQTGSQTGADAPPSSLPEGQAHRESTSPQDEVRQNFSPSTTDTDSVSGQTSSTPATTTGGKRKMGRHRSRG